jgi:hypothetical protein
MADSVSSARGLAGPPRLGKGIWLTGVMPTLPPPNKLGFPHRSRGRPLTKDPTTRNAATPQCSATEPNKGFLKDSCASRMSMCPVT